HPIHHDRPLRKRRLRLCPRRSHLITLIVLPIGRPPLQHVGIVHILLVTRLIISIPLRALPTRRRIAPCRNRHPCPNRQDHQCRNQAEGPFHSRLLHTNSSTASHCPLTLLFCRLFLSPPLQVPAP